MFLSCVLPLPPHQCWYTHVHHSIAVHNPVDNIDFGEPGTKVLLQNVSTVLHKIVVTNSLDHTVTTDKFKCLDSLLS